METQKTFPYETMCKNSWVEARRDITNVWVPCLLFIRDSATPEHPIPVYSLSPAFLLPRLPLRPLPLPFPASSPPLSLSLSPVWNRYKLQFVPINCSSLKRYPFNYNSANAIGQIFPFNRSPKMPLHAKEHHTQESTLEMKEKHFPHTHKTKIEVSGMLKILMFLSFCSKSRF